MPAKRIRSHVQATTGGGGGTTTIDVPSARWAEDLSNSDDIVMRTVLAEDVSIDDAFKYLMLQEGEDVQTSDDWTQTIISANAEDVPVNDLTVFNLISVDVSRTGTPDNDLMFDAYTNQLVAFAGTNFGNVSPITCRGVTTVSPGTDEQRAYIAIDFTGYSGCTSVPTTFNLVLQIANSNLLTATTLTASSFASAAKPFTESTVTWNAPPTLGTSTGNTTVSVAAGGAFSGYTIGFAAGTMNQVLGKWMLIVFTGPSAATTALVDTFSIKSRDDATASNRPKLTFSAQRGT